MISAKLIIAQLRKNKVSHVVGVPDNGSKSLFGLLTECEDISTVFVSREGEAFAIASGLLVGGAKPLVLIQNTGLLEAGDAYRGTAYNMGLALVSIIGYRGFGGHREGRGRVDTAATFLEPTLDAWHLPYSMMTEDGHAELISTAFDEANATCTPRAVVLATQTS